jgi:hypothetical protein
MRLIPATLLILALAASASASAQPGLSATRLQQLEQLPAGDTLAIDGVPDGFGGVHQLTFERIEVVAPGARILVVDATGEHELPRSARVHLLGRSADGAVQASLSFDPGFTQVAGVGRAGGGSFVLSADGRAAVATLQARPLEDSLPPGVIPEIIPTDDGLPGAVAASGALDALAMTLGGDAAAGGLRTAVVAVDTDNELLAERFGNNASAANAWIGDLFAAMNVMYRRDLGVQLQQGTTILRTSTDPWSQGGTPANNAQLTEFGSWWQSHQSGVPRAFAMLLSGKADSGNSASGIAWINAYCRTAAQGGGYSVTQVFTNPQVSVGFSALIVGHELGHNFGAHHTHCTSASSGAAPTGSNTIDKCYSGESGCWSGATSCPTSGPGAPAGTVMSYCNVRGCGSNGQNVLQFHPTQISLLANLVAQNTPSCLAPATDLLFRSGFE